MSLLSLGLAYIAAALDDQGHMVKILNLMMQIAPTQKINKTDTEKSFFSLRK